MTANNIYAGLAALTLSFSACAAGADPGRTREQVLAELKDARQAGELSIGDSGMTERELSPHRDTHAMATAPKPLAPVTIGGKTRAEVRAELQAARTAGELGYGDSGFTQRQIAPSLFKADGATGIAHIDKSL